MTEMKKPIERVVLVHGTDSWASAGATLRIHERPHPSQARPSR